MSFLAEMTFSRKTFYSITMSLTGLPTTDFSEEINFTLRDVYNKIIENLQLSKTKMQQQYNKNIRFNDYKSGDNVWLKTKQYKSVRVENYRLEEMIPDK